MSPYLKKKRRASRSVLLALFWAAIALQGTAACLQTDPTRENALDPLTTIGIIPYLPAVISSGSFIKAGTMNFPRRDYAAVKLNDGRVFISGGFDKKSIQGAYNSAEIYDPETNTFTNTNGNMTFTRYDHTAVLLNDGKVLVSGGSISNGNTAEVFDPATGLFTAVGNMTTARSDHSAVLLADGRVLIIGGCGSSCVTNSHSSAELFTPGANTFAATGSMISRRHDFPATLIGTRVLVVGGVDTQASLSTAYHITTEWYEPGTGLFSAGPNMGSRRGFHTLTKFSDTRYLITGGRGNSGQLASAEIFDTTTELFSPAGGALSIKRQDHAAVRFTTSTTLKDHVLILGGYNSDTQDETVGASAELFNPATGQVVTQLSMLDYHYEHQAFSVTQNGVERIVVIAGDGGAGTDEAYQYGELYIPY